MENSLNVFPYRHIGVQKKPEGCKICPYAAISAGFLPDWSPIAPKIALLCEASSTDEILNGIPWTGGAGWKWFYDLIASNGRRKEDVLISKTLRCNPPGYPWRKTYPNGTMRAQAESACRQYDDLGGRERDKTSLKTFDPDMFIVSLHPSVLLKSPSALLLLREHFAKAFRFSDAGRRPVVALGDKALGIVAPYLKGSSKRWSGHWSDWNYAEIETGKSW